jgi:hypothetical protein
MCWDSVADSFLHETAGGYDAWHQSSNELMVESNMVLEKEEIQGISQILEVI